MINASNMKISSAFLLLALIGSFFELNTAKKFCGPALDEILLIVCDGVYNKIMKKSVVSTDVYNDIDDDLPSLYTGSAFFNKIHSGGSMLAKTRRRRHGVYDECCRKGCNYQELLSYCAM